MYVIKCSSALAAAGVMGGNIYSPQCSTVMGGWGLMWHRNRG